jgi:hypothetical protein
MFYTIEKDEGCVNIMGKNVRYNEISALKYSIQTKICFSKN